MEIDLQAPSTSATEHNLEISFSNHDGIKINSSNKTKNRKKLENGAVHQSDLDPNCIIHINKRLVRVAYPGEVKNLDKAIETLGGIVNIESVQRKIFLLFL